MKLTLKQMHYFDALARALHFGKAAASVNISQPALSAQIIDMEARLERKLVERRHGKVVLTEAGQRILPHIRRILRDAQALEEMLSQDRGLLVGQLKLGMIPTVAPYLLPKLIPHLQAHYPKLQLKVREAITDTLARELLDGTLDAVVAAAPIGEAGLHAEPLFRDRFFIASATAGTDILHSPLTEDQVALDRLLLLDEGHCLRDQALTVCAKGNERRLVNFGATSMTTLLQMVASGMGLTLLPEIAIRAETGKLRGLTITPFADPIPHRDIALFWRQSSKRLPDFGALAESVKAVAEPLLQTEDLAA
ncbi:hydrogen peroxide-inducible genes activator [Oricola sp.]|uniref:hydrogen peroxide-inducible genes activator n=1 Tax=Oricola sp. TaxID=1979950 RepID=UPI0025F83DAA|nr:hydrogen peroxide-inducible genes activator [Oricola sp.]MCI5075327.1 LysR substrate-binding domain-containing protein [Oricola sp.]